MKKRRKRLKKRWIVAVTVLAVCIGISCQYRPLVLDGACKAAKNRANEVINQTVCDTILQEEWNYEKLINVISNESGVITSMQADASRINYVKTQTALNVRNALSKTDTLNVSVPLGTMLGTSLLSGIGPAIPCKALLSSVPHVALEYHFDGAGINQTLHSIVMVVTVPLSVTLPLQSRDIEVKASFLIGETILVGEVPDSYTNVISDPEVADDIFNYGDAG